ncbi:MAG: (Na+)-NQR maturation NqrM [Halieaceae bacterium]
MIYVLTFLAFALVVGAMSVGVMAGRDPIKGSCGGIGALGIDQSCDICGGDPQRCETETRSDSSKPGAIEFDPTER